jgi:hypothetical protein
MSWLNSSWRLAGRLMAGYPLSSNKPFIMKRPKRLFTS